MIVYYLRYTDTVMYYGKGDVMVSKVKAQRFATKEQAEQAALISKLSTEIVSREVKL